MNQNRLVINQVAGANIVEYELDLYDDVPLPINKSIIDIQNIAERKSDFTKTITYFIVAINSICTFYTT
jgi:hypothetical protein